MIELLLDKTGTELGVFKGHGELNKEDGSLSVLSGKAGCFVVVYLLWLVETIESVKHLFLDTQEGSTNTIALMALLEW